MVYKHSEIKRGKGRMVINYKRLNFVTKSFNYPPPHKETLFERIAGCQYFLKFDCKSGFYQIMVKVEDRWKTTFS
ncbi:reverse transcriptase domain-containing protein, partial [Paenibacillus peoriae]|uniref:reverse transcriptase domain-containing protein n=1 Tax=Paenibacillus peoriae TaxID=59893 RepID=UPI003F9949D4